MVSLKNFEEFSNKFIINPIIFSCQYFLKFIWGFRCPLIFVILDFGNFSVLASEPKRKLIVPKTLRGPFSP